MNTLGWICGSLCGGGLLLIGVGILAARWMERRELSRHPVPRTCRYCEHYRAGDLDARTNWVHCARGRRLIADEQKTIRHVTEEGQTIPVTDAGWSGGDGFGEPMLGRSDCPDWQRQGFRLDLGNMEY